MIIWKFADMFKQNWHKPWHFPKTAKMAITCLNRGGGGDMRINENESFAIFAGNSYQFSLINYLKIAQKYLLFLRMRIWTFLRGILINSQKKFLRMSKSAWIFSLLFKNHSKITQYLEL